MYQTYCQELLSLHLGSQGVSLSFHAYRLFEQKLQFNSKLRVVERKVFDEITFVLNKARAYLRFRQINDLSLIHRITELLPIEILNLFLTVFAQKI